MHIILAVAITRDGFINRDGQKHASDWTSKEDQAHFSKLLKEHRLYLMGRRTYEDNKDIMRFSADTHRVVFTHTPEAFTPLPGMLTFTAEAPGNAVERLRADGYKEALLLGGGELFTEFLDASLVDEAFVTIEPLEFGSGTPFNRAGKTLLEYPYLKLESDVVLNASGTRLLHYIRK